MPQILAPQNILKHEDKIDIELITKIMTKKNTALPSLKNQDWKKVTVESEKLSKLLPNSSMGKSPN